MNNAISSSLCAGGIHDLVNLGWLRVFDTTLSWTYSVQERVTVKPSIGFYSIFNLTSAPLAESKKLIAAADVSGTGAANGVLQPLAASGENSQLQVATLGLPGVPVVDLSLEMPISTLPSPSKSATTSPVKLLVNDTGSVFHSARALQETCHFPLTKTKMCSVPHSTDGHQRPRPASPLLFWNLGS